MDKYTSLGAEVEAEYDEFCANPERDLNQLYEKLFRYLKYMAWKFMNESHFVDEAEIEDIASEVLAYVSEEVLFTFRKEQARFSTYCAQIVKNKVMSWKKRRIRLCLESEYNSWDGLEASTYGGEYHSPEYQLLVCESRLEAIEMVKKYIKALMEWKQKPYRTIGCGYTMIIFQKYHPETKELTSPKWAYQQLDYRTVGQGANQFLAELRSWMPNAAFVWNEEFLDAMEKEEEGILIKDIIFGGRFTAKDFENWSLRLREKLKRYLLESEEGFCL